MKAKTLSETLAEEKGELLVDVLANMLAEVQAETKIDTVSKMKEDATVYALASRSGDQDINKTNTLTQIKARDSKTSVANVRGQAQVKGRNTK